MALKKKGKPGITRLPDVISTERGGTSVTRTEIWVGPYDELKIKLQAEARSSPSTSTRLTHEAAGEGRLEITRTSSLPDPSDPSNPSTPTYEIEWVEVRKKLQEHPRYASIPADQLRIILDHIANPREDVGPALTDPLAIELYTKLLRGQTEYSVAAPVVRSTTTSGTMPAAQGAWMRSTPPISVPGSWQWLKTADRITKAGRLYTRSQEWTGAQTWDTDIYP